MCVYVVYEIVKYNKITLFIYQLPKSKMNNFSGKKVLAVMTFSFLILTSCSNIQTESNSTSKREASFVQAWFPFSGYAGELKAVKIAEKNNLTIKVDAGSDNVDPIKLVESGVDTFGIAGADRVITANAKGADLVIIGVANMQNPAVFLTKEKDAIKKAEDFRGKKVGVLTGTDTEYLYKALLAKAGLTSKDVYENEIPFDLHTFILGKYDVTVTLDQAGIPYHIIKPSEYGIHFIGTVYFTKRETIKNNPQMVQTFVNALAAGWESVLQNPAEGITLLKEYDASIDAVRELASLEKGKDFFRGDKNKVLTVPYESWAETQNILISVGAMTEPVKIDSMLDMSFINNYHSNKK